MTPVANKAERKRTEGRSWLTIIASSIVARMPAQTSSRRALSLALRMRILLASRALLANRILPLALANRVLLPSRALPGVLANRILSGMRLNRRLLRPRARSRLLVPLGRKLKLRRA